MEMLLELLKQAVDANGDRPAVVTKEARFTYSELWDYSLRAAGKLRRRGIEKGDRVTIELSRGPKYAGFMIGAWMCGAVFAALDSIYPKDRLDFIAADCGAKLRVDGAFLEGVEAEEPVACFEKLNPFDPSLLIYTSGSTGRPKGVLHSHQSMYDSIQRTIRVCAECGISSGISHGESAPFSFVAGIVGLFSVLCNGSTHYPVPYDVMRDPEKLADFMEENGITAGYISPKMLRIFSPRSSTFRFAVTGSERVSGVYREDFRILNGYGSSESASGVMFFLIDRAYENTPIGKPVGQEKVYILDEEGHEAEEGELCLTGNFALGYLNRPEENARTFVPNPFVERDGFPMMLRSGDMARRLPDGNCLYINRKDWMVKINGQRVEPGEIDECLRGVSGVQEVMTRDFTGAAGQIYLCSFYTLRPDARVTEDQLREAAVRHLPEYMVPAFYVKLDAMPMTASGKVDRNALKAPAIAERAAEYVPPRDALERQLCDAFASALGLERAGILDDFFRLGGDSIRVMALQQQCADLGLSTRTIYECRTPEKLAERIREVQREESTAPGALPEEPAPLNQAQLGIFLSCEKREGEIAYNNPIVLRFPASTDVTRLRAAVASVLHAHPALSARIVTTAAGEPAMQYVPFAAEEELCPVERLPEGEVMSRAGALIQPFHLHHDRLCRFRILESDAAVRLFMDLHHIIFDGFSMKILLPELLDAYLGQEPSPERYTAWHAALDEYRERQTDAAAGAKARMLERFGDVDEVSLPEGDRKDRTPAFGARRIPLRVTAGELRSCCARSGTTENVLTLAAFGRLLSSWTMKPQAAFATVYNGRQDLRTARTVSMFVRTLPVLCRVDPAQTVQDYLAAVKDGLLEAMASDLFSFAELTEVSGWSSDILFTWQDDLFIMPRREGLAVTAEDLPFNATGETLSLQMFQQDDSLMLDIQYRSDRYSESFIGNLAAGYDRVLRGLMEKRTMAEIGLLDEAETQSVLELSRGADLHWNPEETWLRLFAAQAEKTPDKTAVVAQDGSYTYRELARVSDSVAAWLMEKGIDSGFVAIRMRRVREFFPAVIGIQKAGAAYIPIDPSYPEERIAYMLEDSGTALVLTEESVLEAVRSHPDAAPVDRAEPLKPAYMIYTSGSTGKPKGAVVPHRALRALCAWTKENFGLSENSRNVHHPSFSFDASLLDIVPPLCCGGTTWILNEEDRLDPEAIAEIIRANDINGMGTSTQLGMALINAHPDLPLRYINVGGEQLLPFARTNIRVLNCYGPTEFTVISSFYEVDQDIDQYIPIGRPVPGSWSLICDPSGALLPQGMTGELCLAGPQIAEGYWNRPELNAQRFCACAALPGQRMYRTGDLARYREDGLLEYLGRMDNQVKLRGFRIELSEVERQASLCPGVSQTAAEVRRDQLVLYYTAEASLTEQTLRESMARSLTDYMMPSVFVRMEAMPLTPNGKIDRKALPEPRHDSGGNIPPRNETQQRVFDCVAGIIGHRDFGIRTELADAGLTSIGAFRLTTLLAKTFNTVVRTADLRDNPTVELLARFLDDSTGKGAREPVPDYAIRQSYPLSGVQQGIYVECLANPDTTVYNVPFLLRLDPSVDLERLREAVRQTIDAHPHLKTRLKASPGGEIMAFRDDAAAIEIPIQEQPVFSGLVRPFRLTEEPLVRCCLIRDPGGPYFFFDAHHIVFDGESLEIFMHDLEEAYGGVLPEKESYTGFEAALDERARRESPAYDAARDYYRDLLSGLDTDCLPVRDRNSAVPEAGRLSYRLALRRDELERFLRETRTTPNALLNAAFGLTLQRFLCREDSVYTTVYNGRSDSRLARSVGMFVHTLPVVCRPLSGETGSAFVARIGDQLRNSMNHDIFSFAEISRSFGVRADILFVYEGSIGAGHTLGGKPVQPVSLGQPDSLKAPLTIYVQDAEDGFTVECEYGKERYEDWHILSLLESMETALKALLRDESPETIPLLTRAWAERLNAFNQTDTPLEEADIPTLFRRAAAEYPDHTAVIFREKRMSYRELDELSDRIAAHAVSLGLGAEDVVSILIPRSEMMAAAALGALKAGAAYQPLDPGYPSERLQFMVEDARAGLLIADESLLSLLPDYSGPVLLLRDIPDLPAASLQAAGPSDPDRLFILLYTSGTTGVPKGVMLTQRNLVNFCGWYRSYYGLTPDSTVAAYASFGFDASMMDLFPALTTGAAVCVVPEDLRLDLHLLNDYYGEHGVTHVFMTTQMGRMFAAQIAGTGIKHLSVGGEKLVPLPPPEGYTMTNGYGPTECTIFTTTQPVDRLYDRIPIGAPLSNYRLYVVDSQGHLLPAGAIGELWIAGRGVGRGYLNRPDLTEKVFTPNPFCAEPGFDRVFRTGDLVRRLPDGRIDFIGRNDGQVKVRGFRVELAEIEGVIREFGVRDVTVQAFDDEAFGGKYIAAYVVADAPVDFTALSDFIRGKKPSYMVPAAFMQLESIPMNQNQKVNRRALPRPERREESREFVEPATPLEREICEEYAAILGLEKVSATDSFFDIGGSSISAAELVMFAMNRGYNIVYKDIFANPSPRELARAIAGKGKEGRDRTAEDYDYTPIDRLIAFNSMEHVEEITAAPLQDIILTGATGFLGIHVLYSFLKNYEGTVTCLMRRGSYATAERRLIAMLMYYFGENMTELFGKRIFCAEGDITEPETLKVLDSSEAGTVINCAASVKHFTHDDTLDRVNVGGVENLIDLCVRSSKRLVQISTLSVAGEMEAGSTMTLRENMLYFGQNTENDYVRTKFLAERAILEARVRRGLDAVILRAGNLMGRNTDGEFQINFASNAFMRHLWAYIQLGECPFSTLEYPVELSPIDATADAVLALAGVDGRFSVFHLNNNHLITMADLLGAIRHHGFEVKTVSDEHFGRTLAEAAKREDESRTVLSLVAYSNKQGENLRSVDSEHRFTINALFRLGFRWPMIGDSYLKRIIEALDTLDFFSK